MELAVIQLLNAQNAGVIKTRLTNMANKTSTKKTKDSLRDSIANCIWETLETVGMSDSYEVADQILKLIEERKETIKKRRKYDN
jgi:hypothetical protein